MAIKTIKTFSTVDKKFDPETTMDKSTDNMLFNASQVETAYTAAKSKAENFVQKMGTLGSQISKIGNAGLKGTTITQAISTYNQNVAKVAQQISTAKGSFTKAVESKFEQLSAAEKAAAGLAGGVGALGQTLSNANDAVMNIANDIISWAKQGIENFDPSVLGPVSQSPLGKQIGEGIADAAGTVWNKVTDVATDVWNGAKDYVTNFDPSTVVAGVQNAGQAVADGVSNAASTVSNWVDSITPW